MYLTKLTDYFLSLLLLAQLESVVIRRYQKAKGLEKQQLCAPTSAANLISKSQILKKDGSMWCLQLCFTAFPCSNIQVAFLSNSVIECTFYSTFPSLSPSLAPCVYFAEMGAY